jgi:hypothetical protein
MTNKLPLTERTFQRIVSLVPSAPLHALLTLNEHEVNPLLFRCLRERVKENLKKDLLKESEIICVLNGSCLNELPLRARTRLLEFIDVSYISSDGFRRRIPETFSRRRSRTRSTIYRDRRSRVKRALFAYNS